jgi:hypothetical protein
VSAFAGEADQKGAVDGRSISDIRSVIIAAVPLLQRGPSAVNTSRAESGSGHSLRRWPGEPPSRDRAAGWGSGRPGRGRSRCDRSAGAYGKDAARQRTLVQLAERPPSRRCERRAAHIADRAKTVFRRHNRPARRRRVDRNDLTGTDFRLVPHRPAVGPGSDETPPRSSRGADRRRGDLAAGQRGGAGIAWRSGWCVGFASQEGQAGVEQTARRWQLAVRRHAVDETREMLRDLRQQLIDR